jgi:chromatin assembly factor 1 subunit A
MLSADLQAQSRLGSFFTPKPISKTAPAAASPVKSSGTPSFHFEAGLTAAVSKPIQTEYEATFLPFCLPSHTTFPKNYMERIDPEKTIDFYGSEAKPAALSDFPRPPPRTSPNMSVRQIMELLQGPASSAIGPAGEINLAHLRAMEMLQQVEMKYLHFHENVRPPYHGTWTKPLSRLQWRSLAVNPESKVDIFDYDYDSEAEWEEPEDGEDIRSQGEEDEDEADGGDDLEGFVVEDGVSGSPSPKRSLFANDMVPVCTGLRWEDPKGAQHPSDISGARIDFDELRMGFLLSTCCNPNAVHLPNRSSAGAGNRRSALRGILGAFHEQRAGIAVASQEDSAAPGPHRQDGTGERAPSAGQAAQGCAACSGRRPGGVQGVCSGTGPNQGGDGRASQETVRAMHHATPH